jgi:hypothetical protein
MSASTSLSSSPIASLVDAIQTALIQIDNNHQQRPRIRLFDKSSAMFEWRHGARLTIEIANVSSFYDGFSRWSKATVTLCIVHNALQESVTGSIENCLAYASRIATWIHRCAILGQPTPAAVCSAQPAAAELFRAVLADPHAKDSNESPILRWLVLQNKHDEDNASYPTSIEVAYMPPRELYELEFTSNDPIYMAYKLGRVADGKACHIAS